MGGDTRWRHNLKRRLFARQYGLCAICLESMNSPLEIMGFNPDPEDPTFEHIVPISKGGYRTRVENVVLTHQRCNHARDDKMAEVVEVPHPYSQALGSVKKLVIE